MLKKLFIILLISLSTQAQTFTKKATNQVQLLQAGSEKNWCPVCGMKLENFYKTNYAAKLENGTQRQYCSMHSLIEDINEYGIDEKSILVIDVKSEKFVKASEAFYVLGSKIKGTMSQISKLAFLNKEDAMNFQKKYGGKIVDFQSALKHARTNLKTDTRILKTKKLKKVYPMGAKIYKKRCKEINPSDFIEINELKAHIKENKICKNIKEKQLQALSLYLWEVKRLGGYKALSKIQVEERDRCPVCGMFVAKYPRWVAQMVYTHDKHEHKFSFDGAKDLMKFYFNPKKFQKENSHVITNKTIKEILVTDYYSQEPIDGFKAFYVSGSDVYGPMGNELIPFEKMEDAKIFKKDHKGLKILSFEQIEEKEVYKLDE